MASVLARSDAELIRRRGFGEFIKRGWGTVEKKDPLTWNWHIDAISDALSAVRTGEIKNLLINVPPGHTKSLSTCVLFPAWVWTLDPAARFIASAYAIDLALRDARRMLRLVNSEWYQERFGNGYDREADKPISKGDGVFVPRGTQSASYFANNRQGYRFSTAVGAGAIGRHGDYILGDDLVRGQDAKGKPVLSAEAMRKATEFWFDDLETRGLGHTARVLIMQRLHYEDPPKRCIDEGYTTLILPAEYDPKRKCIIECIGFEDPRTESGEVLDKKRMGRELLEVRKKRLGSVSYEAQYQQNPAPKGGTIFKKAWLQYWGVPGTKYPVLPQKEKLSYTQSWDLNSGARTESGSFVVGQVWARVGADHLLIHQVKDRFDTVEIISELLKLSKSHDARRKLIEKKAAGSPVASVLKGKVSGIVLVDPGSASKTERAIAVTPTMEGGNVFLPHPSIATFDVDDLEKELLQFPLSSNDDQVDALTQYLQHSGGDSYSMLERAMGAFA